MIKTDSGKIHSEESKKKMSESHKGNRHSDETKRKISEHHRQKGKPLPKEAREILLKSNIGKHRSEETKRKLSEALKGKPLSIEHKKNISESLKGSKGSGWKGGITPIAQIIRTSSMYLKWRQDVFIRDNFTCQECGKFGIRLEVHHKKSFSHLLQEVKEYLPLLSIYEGAMVYTPLWDILNGITFCKECHKKHKYINK